MPIALVIKPTAPISKEASQEWPDRAYDDKVAQALKDSWDFRTVRPKGGPEFIDSWIDSSLATVGMLSLIKDHKDVDGIVIACFSDPGLFAIREIVDVPVVGIAESSFLTACMIGFRFGILGGTPKDIPWMENILWNYGLEKRCAGVVPINMSVEETRKDRERTITMLGDASRKLISMGAESVILGCGSWSGYRSDLEIMVGAPVIEPIQAACWQLRALVEMGLRSSRAGMYIKPAPKELPNMGAALAPTLAKWLTERAKRGFNE